MVFEFLCGLGIVSILLTDFTEVLEFTDYDFSSRVNKHDNLLVMFYAPTCGHCKELLPEYEKAAGVVKHNDPPIMLAKVDCTEAGKETCNKFGVTGYPTLNIFKGGEVNKEYTGPRDADAIVKYMKFEVGPSSKELTSRQAFNDFIGKPETGVVGVFEVDSPLKSSFLKLADKLREKLRFGHLVDKLTLATFSYKDNVILFRAKHLNNMFEPSHVIYDGEAKEDNLEKWINNNFHGLVGHRTRDVTQDFPNPLIVAYYGVDFKRNPKGTKYWRDMILEVAKSFADDFNFAISAKDDFQHELIEFGYDVLHSYDPGDKPVVCARNAHGQKFVMKDQFSIENLEKFLNELKDGKLKPYLKSDPIPEGDSGPVKIAVAKNFDEVVTDNGKDTLIEFYAPWCRYCKNLAPVYEELGQKMADEDVEIVKMDASNNDVSPPYEVRGFPTLYWASKDDKAHPVKYEGGRHLDDFIKYIAQHSSMELKGFDRKGAIVKYTKSQVSPSSKELTSIQAHKDFIGKPEVGVVGYFEGDSSLKSSFLKLADKLREKIHFDYVPQELTLEEATYKDNVFLYSPKHLHNKFEPDFVVYDGEAKEDNLENWINKNFHGLVGHRTRDVTQDFQNPLIVAYYGVDFKRNPEGTNYWRNRIFKVAKSFADDFNFAISAKDDFQHELNEFGYDRVPGDKPVVFARIDDGLKFVMKDEFSIENFEKFLNELKDGKLEPYLKSEPIPEDNSSPVKIAVAKNFDEVVTHSGKDTLIEFYAPWCGHCKKLAHEYDELVEKEVADDADLVS